MTTPSARLVIQQLTDISKRLFTRAGGQGQVTEARLLLEAGLAWLAAQKATEEDLDRRRRRSMPMLQRSATRWSSFEPTSRSISSWR